MSLKYTFVNSQGEKKIDVTSPYQMLNDISNCNNTYLNEIIDQLEKVIKGDLEYLTWGGTDYCTIDSAELESMVFYDFGEKDLILPTKELLKLLKEYKEYRKK